MSATVVEVAAIRSASNCAEKFSRAQHQQPRSLDSVAQAVARLGAANIEMNCSIRRTLRAEFARKNLFPSTSTLDDFRDRRCVLKLRVTATGAAVRLRGSL